MKTPTVRELRQRVVWRLFDARNRCTLAHVKAVTDPGPETWAAQGRDYDRFRRLAWKLAREIHPTRKGRRPISVLPHDVNQEK